MGMVLRVLISKREIKKPRLKRRGFFIGKSQKTAFIALGRKIAQVECYECPCSFFSAVTLSGVFEAVSTGACSEAATC